MQFLMSRGCTIHYRTIGLEGGKPVIVFINSLGTDFRIWEFVMAALGDDYAYVLHDKRGHGLSDVGSTPYTIETHADDLAALLDHLSVRRAAIWGLSIGGLIAQCLYKQRPDLVGALILSNTAHKIGSAEMWSERIGRIERDGLEPSVEPVTERWFTPAFRKADNPLYAGARNMLSRQSAEGYAASCTAIRDADFTEAAGAIAVPTLCVAGDGDGSTPPDLVRQLAALIPNSRFVSVADCGHIPCLEQPDAYARAVGSFLKSLPESSDLDR